MGRVLMVTRTINATKVTFNAANADTQQFEKHEITLSGALKDKPDKLNKALKDELKGSNLGMPTVVSCEEISDLYGMTEKEFLQYAHKMDKRSAKEATETEE